MESTSNTRLSESKKHDSKTDEVEKPILKASLNLETKDSKMNMMQVANVVKSSKTDGVEKPILKPSFNLETKDSKIKMMQNANVMKTETEIKSSPMHLEPVMKMSSKPHRAVSIMEDDRRDSKNLKIHFGTSKASKASKLTNETVQTVDSKVLEAERKMSKNFILDPSVKTSKIVAGIKSGSKIDLMTKKSSKKSDIDLAKIKASITAKSHVVTIESGYTTNSEMVSTIKTDQSSSQKTESEEDEDEEEEYDEFEIYKYDGERDIYYRRHGYGSMLYPNGDCYVGMWFKGSRSGKGSYTYLDGSVYVGEWDSGTRAGEGMMKYNDQSSYDGEWFNDQRHGWGKYEFTNGDIFEGQFVHGKMHGWKGIYSFANPPHLYYVGPFKNNDISVSDCAQVGTGKLCGIPGNRITAERLMYIDRNRPYSAEKAVDELKCPSSDEEDISQKEEIVTDWSDI